MTVKRSPKIIIVIASAALLAGSSAQTEEPLKPHQTVSEGQPPKSPTEFDPDPTASPVLSRMEEWRVQLKIQIRISVGAPPLSPSVFNSDPPSGPVPRAAIPKPLFDEPQRPHYGSEPLPEALQLPRAGVRRVEIVEVEPDVPLRAELAALPTELKLPRERVRRFERIETQWGSPAYPIARRGLGYPPHSEPKGDRWQIGFAPWRRYTAGDTETPYAAPTPMMWHPYRQSVLKGDAPIFGQDVFLNLTLSSETVFESRRLPTPSAVSSEDPKSAEFFGRGEQLLLQNYFSFTADLFRGETVFQPIHWSVRLQPIANINYTATRETTVINPNPRHGTDRTDGFVTLQQWFGELHLGDLSANYDFAAARLGNQVFNSDFRGFVFNDTNLGLRFFGNADNNRWQYNLAVFDMREKDTNSELNTFDARDQRVVIANVFRQDFLVSGYNAQLSFHANLDDGYTHYDDNGNIARPAPLGTVEPHSVRAYYFGWAGDGHIGRWNATHQFYQVFGCDELNGLAGREVNINAQMAALEVSYDRDWIRYKASFFYASGDGDAEDGTGGGFDSIVDNPNITGGPFSYWSRQGFGLAGTSVALKQRNSLVPNLRTSKTEGQSNFVNPGVFIFGVGTEVEVTPKLRGFLNANYLRFAETDPIKTALLTNQARSEIGLDLSLGFQYRPQLTDNVIVSAGVGALIPGSGYRDIYRRNTDPVPGYNPRGDRGATDDFLYSALVAVTLTY